MAAVSAAYLVVACIGGLVAVEEGLPAAFLGIRTGLTPLQDWLFAMGTALSPPAIVMVVQLVLTVVLVRGGRRRGFALRGLTVLALMEFLGMLGEPITYQVLPPGPGERIHALLVTAFLVLPAVLVVLGARSVLRERPEQQRPDSDGGKPASRGG